MKRGNASAIALGVLFFLFMLFMLFKPEITGSFVFDIGNVETKTNMSIPLKGNFSFEIFEADIKSDVVNITNNSYLKLVLWNADNPSGISRVVYFEELKDKTSPKINFSNNENVKIVNNTGWYAIDLSYFNLASSKNGTFTLSFDLWLNDTSRKLDASKTATIIIGYTNITIAAPPATPPTNRAPKLVEKVENMTMASGGTLEIDASNYFADEDGDRLKYDIDGRFHGLTDVEREIIILEGTAGFEGVDRLRIYAYDSNLTAYSNYFYVEQVIANETQANESAFEEECNPEWSCTAWSGCSNSEMTRTCSNECGIEEGKPAEIESCVESLSGDSGVNRETVQEKEKLKALPAQKDNTSLFIIISFSALLVLIIAGGAFYYFKFAKGKGPNIDASNAEAVGGGGIIGESVLYKQRAAANEGVKENTNQEQKSNANFDEVYTYLQNIIDNKGDVEKAKQDLLDAGWAKQDVERAVNVCNLRKYTADKVKAGYDIAKIRETLISKGWKQDILEDVFKGFS